MENSILKSIYSKRTRKLFLFNLCCFSVWTLNWILYEPIWKRFCFRPNIIEHLLLKSASIHLLLLLCFVESINARGGLGTIKDVHCGMGKVLHAVATTYPSRSGSSRRRSPARRTARCRRKHRARRALSARYVHQVKVNFFLWSLSLLNVNIKLDEPIWNRCRFRPSISEPLFWGTFMSQNLMSVPMNVRAIFYSIEWSPLFMTSNVT